MQQHTGQHVISAIFEHELKNETVGWQLSQSNQRSYLDLERSPTEDDIAFVVRRCNVLIWAATRVRVSVQPEMDHERPDTLPDDYRGGVLRYITIVDLDRNPCCGTHHPSLAFLGSLFIFPGVTRMSGPTRFRLFFAVGDAMVQNLAAAHSMLKDIGTVLECGPSDILQRVVQLQKAKKDRVSHEKVLKAEASRALALDLGSSLCDMNGTQAAYLHREEENTDIEFLSMILHAFRPPTTKWLVVLASGPFAPSNESGGCLLLASSDEGLVKKTSELVKTAFQGRVKGGGKGRWQGKVVGGWERGDQKLFGQILQEAVA
jgi:alanyl-tRNA synthetase